MNGLNIRPNIPTIFTKLQNDSQRFSKLNIDSDRINDPTYIYRTRNVVNQADTMNTLNGIELGLFFKPGEVSTDENGNFTTSKPISKSQESLLKYFSRKQNK